MTTLPVTPEEILGQVLEGAVTDVAPKLPRSPSKTLVFPIEKLSVG